MSYKLQNIFPWFLKVSWIARRFKITFLRFDNCWNVLETPKYFSMILKVSWIAIRPKITLLKFDKSWIILQASKYFSKWHRTYSIEALVLNIEHRAHSIEVWYGQKLQKKLKKNSAPAGDRTQDPLHVSLPCYLKTMAP